MPLPTRPALAATTPAASARLADGFAAIRAELNVPATFPDAVLAEALAEAAPAGRAAGDAGRVDATDVPFVTIDPPGSVDLD